MVFDSKNGGCFTFVFLTYICTMFKLFVASVITIVAVSCNQVVEKSKPLVSPLAIVIHGGAGYMTPENLSENDALAYSEALVNAVNEGYDALEKGVSAVDVVTLVVKLMEDSPLFNAGKGAVYNADGVQEMDAAIMDGSNLNAGAVAGLKGIKNPIEAAKAVMLFSEHVLLVGEGARKFALLQGLDTANEAYFFNENSFNKLLKIQNKQASASDLKGEKFGTVGAVCLDQFGNIAAATSTGGMTNKKYGRVGDVPVIGAGTYANNHTCAVSATGHGEFFIRNVAAFQIASLVAYKNLSVDSAANYVVQDVLKPMNGFGGVIALDKQGNISMRFNTPSMFRAFKTSHTNAQSFIF